MLTETIERMIAVTREAGRIVHEDAVIIWAVDMIYLFTGSLV
jgi:hypothetical protein